MQTEGQEHKSQPFIWAVGLGGGSRKKMVLFEACWGARVSMVSWQMWGQNKGGIWTRNGDIGILHVTNILGKEEPHQREWEEGVAGTLPNSGCNNHCRNSSRRLCWFHNLKDGSSGGERICVVWGSHRQLVDLGPLVVRKVGNRWFGGCYRGRSKLSICDVPGNL